MATHAPTSQQPVRAAAPGREPPFGVKLRLTLAGICILAGVYLLLYVGGLYVQIEYQRLAARGDNDLAVPRAMAPPADFQITGASPAARLGSGSSFVAPDLSDSPAPGQLAGETTEARPLGSTVTRVVIPSVAIDAKVIEVGWRLVEQGGQQVAVWDVAEFAVGHHNDSGNPGDGTNIVFAGHVGGYGFVFRDLYYVKPGDELTVYSGGQAFRYTVTERLLVDEDNAPPAQRAANATLIAPTESEMVTMVTCWPPTGRDKFTQRVIVRAVPSAVEQGPDEAAGPTVR